MTGVPEGTGKQWFVPVGGAGNSELPAKPRTFVHRHRRAGNSELPAVARRRAENSELPAELPIVAGGSAGNSELPAELLTVARWHAGNSELPREWPERTDTELEDAEVPDLSSDHLRVKLYPKDQSPLSEIERRSVVDSVKGFVEFAKRRLLSLAADHVWPVVGGRLVDLGFEILDVVNSVRALTSGDPVLEAPLPSPFPSLDFTLEIPLTRGDDSQAAPPLALCVAPASPSLTGGWALDAAEHDDRQAQEPPADVYEAALERFYSQRNPASRPTATIETSHADQPQPLVRRRSATACLVEIDLDSLPLPRHAKRRAGVLAVLAAEYASRLRENADLGRFELFIIADTGRRCGLWIWLDADIEIGRA